MQSPGRRGRGCFRRFMQSVTEADRPLDSTTLPELGRNRQGWPLQLKPGDRAAAAVAPAEEGNCNGTTLT